MKTYEYLIAGFDGTELIVEQTMLDKLGAAGWELVQIVPRVMRGSNSLHYYFRREKTAVVVAPISGGKRARN